MSDSYNTKYRPERWEEVVGNGLVVESLSKKIAEHRQQVFLLSGPSGLGKTTLARIAANELGCEPGELIEHDAVKLSGVDDTRALMEALTYKPFGDVRVFIIDECHGLSKQAWNSLLMSIEEPPYWAYFFFCTTEPTKVPATIKTRCVAFDLKPVSVKSLLKVLSPIVKQERLKVSEEILVLCAEEALGSPRQAILNLAACQEAKDPKDAAELLRSAHSDPGAIDLARALLRNASLQETCDILKGLKDLGGESVRQVVRAYMTNVFLAARDSNTGRRAGKILVAFSQPCNPQDGLSPIVVAVYKLLAA